MSRLLSLLVLLLTLFLSQCGMSRCEDRQHDNDCSDILASALPRSQCRWLFGEVPVTGLTNQMNTVYMMLPLARLFQSGLLLGPFYSRTSFDITMRQFDKNESCRHTLSLRDLFDERSFLTLARQLQIPVSLDSSITHGSHPLAKCITHNQTFAKSVVHSIQRKQWRAANDSRLLSMLAESQYYQSSVANQCPHILRFHSISKLLGIYSFYQPTLLENSVGSSAIGHWQEEKLQELLLIHRHLQPSQRIQRVIDRLQAEVLPSFYWALHVRLEGDVIRKMTESQWLRMKKKALRSSVKPLAEPWQSLLQTSVPEAMRNEDALFAAELSVWIQSIVSSNCWKEFHSSLSLSSSLNRTVPLPPLFVSSGLISNDLTTLQSMTDKDHTLRQRRHVVLALLQKLGFHEILHKNSPCRTSLSCSAATVTPSAVDSHSSRGPHPITEPLPVELEAAVDLQIVRQSQCIIGAHMKSSFSYFAQRLQELDRNITISQLKGERIGTYKLFFI